MGWENVYLSIRVAGGSSAGSWTPHSLTMRVTALRSPELSCVNMFHMLIFVWKILHAPAGRAAVVTLAIRQQGQEEHGGGLRWWDNEAHSIKMWLQNGVPALFHSLFLFPSYLHYSGTERSTQRLQDKYGDKLNTLTYVCPLSACAGACVRLKTAHVYRAGAIRVAFLNVWMMLS